MLPEGQNDFELIERCLAGEVSAFDTLVQKYQQDVYRLAYRMTLSADDAKDLAQGNVSASVSCSAGSSTCRLLPGADLRHGQHVRTGHKPQGAGQMQHGLYKPYGTPEQGSDLGLCWFAALLLVAEQTSKEHLPGRSALREKFQLNRGYQGYLR